MHIHAHYFMIILAEIIRSRRSIFFLFQSLPSFLLSKWLENELQKSFLSSIPCHQIYNGINLDVFKLSFNINIRKQFEISESTKIILGIASNWYRKGLEDFIKLAGMVSSEYKIILVGINKNDKKLIPANIITITRTENIDELEIYTLKQTCILILHKRIIFQRLI